MKVNFNDLDFQKFGQGIQDLDFTNPRVVKAIDTQKEFWLYVGPLSGNLQHAEIEEIDFEKLKNLNVNKYQYELLKEGKEIEINFNDKIYLFNIDFSNDLGFNIYEPLQIENDLSKHESLLNLVTELGILDNDTISYEDLKNLSNLALEIGYKIDYSLDAQITSVSKLLSLDEVLIVTQSQLIENFKTNNKENTSDLFFLDNETGKIFIVDNVNKEGLIYFKETNTKEDNLDFLKAEDIYYEKHPNLVFFKTDTKELDIDNYLLNLVLGNINNQNTNINQNSNIMAELEQNANDIEVKGAKTAEDKPVIVFSKGDPVAVRQDNKTYVGKFSSAVNDTIDIDVKKNGEEVKIKALTSEVEPLFYVNKEDQKVYLRFSYNEVGRALKNTDGLTAKLEGNQFMGLMAGERSKVMPYETRIENEMRKVEGRLELRRDQNGNAYVSGDVKHKELNLDLPIYGVKLDENQKKTLSENGELGLVQGFKAGDKEFALWVGLDKQLNKVVTKPEKSVYIDKVFGVTLDDNQKKDLKSGQGTLITTKNNKELYIRVMAGGTSSDGLGVYQKTKALELGFIKENTPEKEEEKKKNNGVKR